MWEEGEWIGKRTKDKSFGSCGDWTVRECSALADAIE